MLKVISLLPYISPPKLNKTCCSLQWIDLYTFKWLGKSRIHDTWKLYDIHILASISEFDWHTFVLIHLGTASACSRVQWGTQEPPQTLDGPEVETTDHVAFFRKCLLIAAVEPPQKSSIWGVQKEGQEKLTSHEIKECFQISILQTIITLY